ncbi:hypothetical protein ONS96_014487 [Cadophora gregata f. sp. sojae]|nr:hypothetical protein ONS96_014487 [Cadophora gregata f. sp. sojae]
MPGEAPHSLKPITTWPRYSTYPTYLTVCPHREHVHPVDYSFLRNCNRKRTRKCGIPSSCSVRMQRSLFSSADDDVERYHGR